MADKNTFFESINASSTYNEDFYKKVYGYSVCDSAFLVRVASKLNQINRKDVIVEYNKWLAEYRAKNNEAMKKVAGWHSKALSNRYEDLIRINERKAVSVDWNQRKKELLQQKKVLLQMRLRQSIGN